MDLGDFEQQRIAEIAEKATNKGKQKGIDMALLEGIFRDLKTILLNLIDKKGI